MAHNHSSMKNLTRQAKVEEWAAMADAKTRSGSLSQGEQVHEKLTQLRTFIRQLQDTPQGRLDLEHRTRVLGPCDPVNEDDENSSAYYGRLRLWLDKDL